MGRVLSVVVLVSLVAQGCRQRVPDERFVRAGSDIFLTPDTEVIAGRVPPRATLAGLLRGHRLRDDVVEAMVLATRAAFDPRQLRADRPYRLERTIDGLLRWFEYEIDADRLLRIVNRANGTAPPSLDAEVRPIDKTREVLTLGGAIDHEASSLFAAMDRIGERPELSIALADIFAGEVDFNSDLQPGDSFRLVIETYSRDGQFAGYGAILAAEFTNAGRRLRAVRFTPPGDKPAYYDEQGRSLRRFFLKSPLKFVPVPQVTSRFSRRRLHPIDRIYKAHFGVDYRAPEGAAVVAVAGGVVSFAGMSGASGRMVRIRHASGYESSYLHLSSIARGLQAGSHVEQNEQIGRVGSTGAATAPHLDFRLRRNGAFVNPLRVQINQPPGEPVAAEHQALFASVRDQMLARIGAPILPPVVAASLR
ncbi:MAG: M23 family metallopeptidase [Acidobacteria bacterium]|nr:M23 family metallopeptidase [Acidobacteriota bacterium]